MTRWSPVSSWAGAPYCLGGRCYGPLRRLLLVKVAATDTDTEKSCHLGTQWVAEEGRLEQEASPGAGAMGVECPTNKHYLACLQDAGIIRSLDRYTLKSLRKLEKFYLGNTALYYAYAELKPDLGSIRETFFLTSMALSHHQVSLHPGQADFAVGPYTFEVGGPRKGKRQIKNEEHSYVVRDT